ncbi:MAG: 16S rRNA (cytidine(1402)-2'-O)-methyltransferase [Clostridiales bacterium]|nr:16S rRNA (cytidine(1402)-2'-O)-methyltransferase [Clostridiales bacterium]
MTGTLYLVATPIGNLDDITFRAINTLKEVDFIAAEDTRQTLKLLNHFEIKKPLLSYHEHNKYEAGPKIIERILKGESVALVTDAGTPGVSDPGEDLVKLAIENYINVVHIPGASAFLYALVVSGLSTEKFVFEGFLNRESKQRRERLEFLKNETRTIIFYEAPHRLIKTLNDLYENFGDRKIALCRELTKRYEEITRCTLSEAIKIYEEKEPKGEYVLVLEGKSKEEIEEEKRQEFQDIDIAEHIQKYIDEGLSKKDAIKKVAKERGLKKSEVYKFTIEE